MEENIPDTGSKSFDSQTDNEDLEHDHSVLGLARQADDARGLLMLVVARSEPPGPINMLSGSTAIFGNVGSFSMSSQSMESKVEQLSSRQEQLTHSVSEIASNVECLELSQEKLTQDVSELREDVKGIKLDHEQLAQGMVNALEDFRKQKDLEPITQESIVEIKKKYRHQHKMHKIHRVNNNNRIVLEGTDVNKFAVKLKINRELPSIDNFRDEARQYFAHLQGITGDDIEISGLTDNENRVTFIRGIAGMGKSVLAKQLTYGWANGEMYQNFKLCLMFECRDLNYFKDHEGAELKKHEILGEFLKSKVNWDLGDGEGVLIIVDGLDELYDITEKDSIIFSLLNINGKYGMAKVIITGRPHIEDKLTGNYDMGGVFKVEINGLSEDQIDEYIDKFSSCEDHKIDINKARSLSKGYLPSMHVPQFLNTLCCAAILMKGQAVSNSTELYCWTVYLLLRQHADKHGASGKSVSKIFKEFSQTLSTLGEVCFNLLTNNKIVFEGDMKVLLGDIGKDKEFIQSLFVDVSDNITEKYQFKHLSLMEFLSALYICEKDIEHSLDIIKYNLEKGFIEVVSFVCRLLSGFSCGGIIKEMLKNVVGVKQEVNEKQLLGDIIKLLNECWLDDMTKLRRSFEIIPFFLHRKFNDKEFIMSIIRKCHGYCRSDEIKTEHIFNICRHLKNCGWTDGDIRLAFDNVQFAQFDVSNFEELEFVAAKTCFRIGVGGIRLLRMTTVVNAIRQKFAGGHGNGFCGVVVIWECKFNDELHEFGSDDRQLEKLDIERCQLSTVSSFINVLDWGMSCRWLVLHDLNIKIEWWEKIVEVVEERQRKGDLKTRRLHIMLCTTRMSHEMAMRIVQCGVKLKIDFKEVLLLPSLLSSPFTIDLSASTMSTSGMTSSKADVYSTVDHSVTPPTSSSPPSAIETTFQVPTNLASTNRSRPSSMAASSSSCNLLGELAFFVICFACYIVFIYFDIGLCRY